MRNYSSYLLIALFLTLTSGQLELSAPQPINYYDARAQNVFSFYDTGSYQVYTTNNGYSVFSEANNQTSIYTNPTCIGTSNSEFFCVSELNNSVFTQFNLTTGQEIELFSFNASINKLTASYDNIIALLASEGFTISVVSPPSQTPICEVTTSSPYTYATYFNDMIVTSPQNPCQGGEECSMPIFYCNGTTTTWNFTGIQLNEYNVIPMFFTEGGVSQGVGFPMSQQGASGTGFISFSDLTYNSSSLNYYSVQQVNSTNIVILTQLFELVQYYFNVTTGTFTQVGPTLPIPDGFQMLLSPISFTNGQTAMILSAVQQMSNFFVNVNTMTITNWVYYNPAQSFSNGTTFSFSALGYFLASGTNIIYNYDSLNGGSPAVYQPYLFPFATPTVAYALTFYNSMELFVLNLTGNAQPSYLPIAGTNGQTQGQFLSVNPSGSGYIVALFNAYPTGNVTFYSTTSGSLFSINSKGSGYQNPMVFIDSANNTAMIYTNIYTLTINTQTWSVANSTFSQQFAATLKVNETHFLGYSMSQLSVSLNITLVNAFSQAIVQSFEIPNIDEVNVGDIQVLTSTTSTGALEAIFISALNEQQTLSQNWIVYADNSNYTTLNATMVIPGPQSGSASFCNITFAGQLLTCTNYALTDPKSNGGNGGEVGGSSGSNAGIIAIIAVAAVLIIAGGFLIRRNMILKRRAGMNSNGIAMTKV